MSKPRLFIDGQEMDIDVFLEEIFMLLNEVEAQDKKLELMIEDWRDFESNTREDYGVN